MEKRSKSQFTTKNGGKIGPYGDNGCKVAIRGVRNEKKACYNVYWRTWGVVVTSNNLNLMAETVPDNQITYRNRPEMREVTYILINEKLKAGVI